MIKTFFQRLIIKSILKRLQNTSDKNIIKILKLSKRLISKEYKSTVQFIIDKAKQGHSVPALFKDIVNNLSPNCRNKLAENLFINSLLLGAKARERFAKIYGYKPPYLMVISPTMKCNLRCTGCYAGEYQQKQDLDFETVDRILTEAKEKLGIYFVTISGGEPFTWPYLFDILKKHNDMYFQIYTNGTLITEELAQKLVEVGNAACAISVEGYEAETDKRRSSGVYRKILNAMTALKEAGVLFGFSATPTKLNADIISSEEFVDFYIAQGCSFGWYFQYIPIGLNPEVSLMSTPEQRLCLRSKIKQMRSTKKIFFGDFWNDGPFVGGCMAAASRSGAGSYFHINCNGDVEPCVFCHFAVDNIKNKTLIEALNSDFFKTIRSQQPYSENLLRPCAIIDNPEVLRNAVKVCNAYPTHTGADSIIKDPKITKYLDDYSLKWKELTDPVWEKEYKNNRESKK